MPYAFLHSIAPKATIRLGAELPQVRPFAVPLIIFKLSLVFAGAIKPLQLAEAMLLIVHPVALIFDTIRPRVHSFSVDMIVHELTFVDAAIGTAQSALSVFLAFNEVANIRRMVRECLFTFAMWMLIHPIALIERSVWVTTDTPTIH